MASPNQLEHVCTHPKVPPPERTAGKCALCMKPLAAESMVTVEGKHFCCDAAANQFFESDAHYQDYLAKEKKGGFGRFIKKLFVFAFLLALIAAAAYYFLGDKGSELIEDVKQKTSEVAP